MTAPSVVIVPVRPFGYEVVSAFCGVEPESIVQRGPSRYLFTFPDTPAGQAVDLPAVKAFLETVIPNPGRVLIRDVNGYDWAPDVSVEGNFMGRRTDGKMTTTMVTDKDREKDRVPDTPRLRRTLAAGVNLTTTWQQLRFRNVSVWDLDTFDTAGAGKRYDMTTDRLVAGTSAGERQYQFEFHWDVTQSALAGTLAATRLQLRLHVPRPVALGGPIFFPFPTKNADGAIDLAVFNHNEPTSDIFTQRLYFNEVVRSYGIQIEARVAPVLLGLLRTLRLTEHTAIALYPC